MFVTAFALLVGASSASATTLIMPDRQALVGNVVVWGNTTLANGTNFRIACFAGDVPALAPVVDRSYITRTCAYPVPGTYTATLTVGAESASAQVIVVDPPANSLDRRNARINAAIEDGLRYLYSSQVNRAARFGTNYTSWSGDNPDDIYVGSFTALALQSIQNHGHSVAGPNTDIFKGVVQRALNFLFEGLAQRDLGACDEDPGVGVRNPCVNVPAPVNIGLSSPVEFHDGYATGIYAAAIAGAAGANPGLVVGAGIGDATYVAGRTYGEVLQRIINAISWGQSNEGGWYYCLQCGGSDGSTMGWALLGLIDGGAAGATIPAWVKTEFAKVLANQLNSDGTLDYQVDNFNNPGNGNMAKVGIGLQGLAFLGSTPSDPKVIAALNYITTNWNSQVSSYDFFYCSYNNAHNKACGYAMFNIFKGLKFLGVTQLPGIGRAAGPGPIPVDDWYADYIDNLLSTQNFIDSPTGGQWGNYDASFNFLPNQMGWSCCHYETAGITALAELILAPVAFVQPDLVKFSQFGLSPVSAINPIGTDHTVTAETLSANNAPVPGVTVTFQVLTGPNVGKSGQGTTDATGKTTFTYHDDGGAGTDTIQAFVGATGSNIVSKTWQNAAGLTCDVNASNTVTMADLQLIRAKNGQLGTGANAVYDANKDGRVNLTDVAYCQRRLTPAQ